MDRTIVVGEKCLDVEHLIGPPGTNRNGFLSRIIARFEYPTRHWSVINLTVNRKSLRRD